MAWFKKFTKKEDEELVPAEQLPEETDEDEGQLAIDVFQDKDNVIVKSTIAGVKPEDLDITIGGNEVTIHGHRKQEEEVSEDNYFYQECYWGSFARSFSLPVEVDMDKATADIKDGILTLVLPKASHSRTKKVKVKSEDE